MFNKFFKTITDFCQVQIKHPTSKVAIALLATAGMAIANAAPLKASESSLPDGTYLYGQSPTPDTIGSEYLVFEVRNGTVAGAFYLPSSEFACFSGTLDARSMNLSVIDPYENEAYPYAIALEPQSPVAEGLASPVEMGLAGYHRLEAPSENDLRMLNVCQGN